MGKLLPLPISRPEPSQSHETAESGDEDVAESVPSQVARNLPQERGAAFVLLAEMIHGSQADALKRLLTGDDQNLPGPESIIKTTARDDYFRVWEYLEKPGNSNVSHLNVSKALTINNDAVSRYRTKMRPPSVDEMKAWKDEQKHRKKK